jgi:FlaA1/EpsC-like NDP-sugar epimerase
MNKLVFWFLSLTRRAKAAILIAVDSVLVMSALWVAFSLRLGELYILKGDIWILFCLSPILAVPIFIRFGLYRAIIRYIGGRAIWAIFQAISLYIVIFTVVAFQTKLGMVPRTVPALNWLVLLFFIGGSRFIARWWLADVYSGLVSNTAKLIYSFIKIK